MPFSVTYRSSKQDIFKKGEEECRKHAELVRKTGDIFIDPDFPHNDKSMGNVPIYYKKPPPNPPWIQPHQLSINEHRLSTNSKWHVWEDPWPFHVGQGNIQNCWLIAALMAISRNKKLLEQIIPRRDYTLKCGIVEVRLYIDGEWRVVITDTHVPHIHEEERFAPMTNKQTWVAFIEKAYAKVKGSYGALAGGLSEHAFRALTGCPSRNINIGMKSVEELWKDMMRYHASGYFMAAGSRKANEQEDEERLRNHGLNKNHAYAILDVKEHDSYRLIKIGNPALEAGRWNGQFSSLPVYGEETLQNFSPFDEALANQKLFWMGIDDFVRFFSNLHVCKYQETEMEEIEFKQKIERSDDGDDIQMVRFDVEKRCEVLIMVEHCDEESFLRMFLHIHRSDSKNHCGDLVFSTEYTCKSIFTESFHPDPGSYLIVVQIHGQNETSELNWKVASSLPVNVELVFLEDSILADSLQKVILEKGKADVRENEIIYTWQSDLCLTVMIENYRKEYIWAGAILKSTNVKDPSTVRCFYDRWLVPPMSRCIIGNIRWSIYEKNPIFDLEFECKPIFLLFLCRWRYAMSVYIYCTDEERPINLDKKDVLRAKKMGLKLCQ